VSLVTKQDPRHSASAKKSANLSLETHLSAVRKLCTSPHCSNQCHGLSLPAGWFYHRVLLHMCNLLIYHSVLSLPGYEVTRLPSMVVLPQEMPPNALAN